MFWHGGRGGCFGASHFGISFLTESPIVLNCSQPLDTLPGRSVTPARRLSAMNASANPGNVSHGWYGHFHSGLLNTGLYAWGSSCVAESEWAEGMSIWLEGQWAGSRYGLQSYGRCAVRITSINECSNAALALGLSDADLGTGFLAPPSAVSEH